MNKKIHILFFALVFVGAARGENIKKYTMGQSYEDATRVINTYPSDKYYVVAMGISTVPFAASMRAQLDPKEAESYFLELPMKAMHSWDVVTEERHRALAKLMPDAKTLAGRTLVVHRVLDEGQSISNFIPDLMSFMHQQRKGTEVHFDFVLGAPFAVSKSNFEEGIGLANLKAPPGAQRLSLEGDFTMHEDRDYAQQVTWKVDRSAPDALINYGRYVPFPLLAAAKDDFRLQENLERAAQLQSKIVHFVYGVDSGANSLRELQNWCLSINSPNDG